MRIVLPILVLLLTYQPLHAQTFELENIHFSGSTDKRINIVILSDGYQENELNKFETDAVNFANTLLGQSPFKEYRDYFNIYIIKVPSNESGASHPGTATDVSEPAHPVVTVDNYFGSSFDSFGIHRLLVAHNISAINTVLALNFPSYDQALILTNSPYYGGSGGRIPVASTEASSAEIAIHELGHSFSNLADEYYAGDQYAAEKINMTQETDPLLVRWKNWYNSQGVGIYQHCCGGNSAQWYRPHENCKMRVLGSPFCAVCTEGTIERIHDLISPIDSYTPADNIIDDPNFPIEFNLNLIKPLPNTLKSKWVLNGVDFENNVDSVLVERTNMISGTNELIVFVQDTTQLQRIDDHESLHEYSISWTINTTPDSGQDDDNDGVVNSEDQCPDTMEGQEVDVNGCEIFPFDAFKIYTETPACPGLEDGLLEITTTESTVNHTFDVELSGNGRTDVYDNLLSKDSPLSITDLPPGDYKVIISLDSGYSKTFDKVVIGEAADISARLENVDNETKSVTYKVSGSSSYTVDINQKQYLYESNGVEETDILIPLEEGLNTFTIKGKNCQSSFEDEIFLNGINIYPNPVDEGFYVSNGYVGKIRIFSAKGTLIKEAEVDLLNNYIDMKEFTSGIYLLHFLKGEKKVLKIAKR